MIIRIINNNKMNQNKNNLDLQISIEKGRGERGRERNLQIPRTKFSEKEGGNGRIKEVVLL